jgi:Spy/CpxP family protein refolding chaperone
MRHDKLAWSISFALVLLAGAPALAQPGPGPAHEHGPGGPAAAGGPGAAGPHHMMGGGMGGHDEGGCDSESCPMKHGHGGMMGDHDDGDQPGMHMAMFEHMADELGLPDATRKKIKDMLYEAQKQSITLHADLEQAKLELQHMMDQDKPDTEAVLKQFDKVAQAKTALAKVGMRTMLEAQKLLTPEQRKKVREHMMKMRGGPKG